MKLILAIALLVGLSDSTVALAECTPGHAAAYSDVESIFVERNGVAGPRYRMMVTKLGDVLFIGREHVSAVGTYDGHDGATLFAELLPILQKRGFYSMQLRPYAETTHGRAGILGSIVIDGPDDHVALQRCGVVTKIETYGSYDNIFLANDENNPQVHALVDLVDELQTPIFAWPWEKERRVDRPLPRPSP